MGCYIFLFGGKCIPVCAQSDIIRSNGQISTIGMLNDYLTFIGDCSQDLELRKKYIEKALRLFVNSGDSFEMNGSVRDGSTISIKSVYRQKTIMKPIKAYLNGILSMRYRPCFIKEATFAVIKVDDLVKVADGKYMATSIVNQTFCGMRDGQPMYKDDTMKNVKLYIDQEQIDRINGDLYLKLIIDVVVKERQNL